MPNTVLNTIKTVGTSLFGGDTPILEALKGIPSTAVTKLSSCGEKCKALIKTYFPTAASFDGDIKKLSINKLFGIFSDFGKFYEDKDDLKDAALNAALSEIGFVEVTEEGGSDESADGEKLSISETSQS